MTWWWNLRFSARRRPPGGSRMTYATSESRHPGSATSEEVAVVGVGG